MSKKKVQEHRPILTNIPSALDIGFTAVTANTQHTFILENANEYAVQFYFEFEKFRIVPDRYTFNKYILGDKQHQ